MRQLTVVVAVVVIGCQRPAPELVNTVTRPADVVHSPTSSVKEIATPSASRPIPVTYISDDRFAGSDPLTTEEVVYLLTTFDHAEDVRRVVVLGERLFPAFEAILNDPTTSEHDQEAVLGLLAGMKDSRSRFMDHALRRLSSKSGDLRRAAVWFLGGSGTEREAALLAVMLLDKDSTVQHAAADALARIGGEREVAVFDLIIHNARRYEDDGELILNSRMLDVYAECRDKLKERLKKAKDAEPKAKPPEKK